MAEIIDGKAISAAIKEDLAARAKMYEDKYGRKIGLAWPVRLTRERERLPSGHFRPCGNIACARL